MQGFSPANCPFCDVLPYVSSGVVIECRWVMLFSFLIGTELSPWEMGWQEVSLSAWQEEQARSFSRPSKEASLRPLTSLFDR